MKLDKVCQCNIRGASSAREGASQYQNNFKRKPQGQGQGRVQDGCKATFEVHDSASSGCKTVIREGSKHKVPTIQGSTCIAGWWGA